jgi:hypothetical protein
VAQDAQVELEGSLQGRNLGCDKNFMPGTFFSGLTDDVRIYSRAVRP